MEEELRTVAPVDDAGDAATRHGSTIGAGPAVAAIGIATFAGAAVVAEAASLGLGLPLQLTTLAVLATGVGSMVSVGLVRPLQRVIASERRHRTVAEAELAHRDHLEEVLTRLDSLLATCTRPEQVLDVLGRSIQRLLPERDHQLLLCSADATALTMRIGLSERGAAAPVRVTGADGCLALTHHEVIAANSTSAFDICPHATDDELPTSSLCIPVDGPSGRLGVLWSVGAEGDLPAGPELRAAARLAERVGRRLSGIAAHAASKGRSGESELIDPLTRLPIHVTAHRVIRELLAMMTPFTIAVCDMDGFAEFNADHGTDAGDVALGVFAQVLAETLRPGDVVCRYGADTFLAVFPMCSAHDAQAAMERVREELVLQLAGSALPPFTASVGIVDSTQGSTIDELVDAANAAVSLAKDEGGNRVRLGEFTPESS